MCEKTWIGWRAEANQGGPKETEKKGAWKGGKLDDPTGLPPGEKKSDFVVFVQFTVKIVEPQIQFSHQTQLYLQFYYLINMSSWKSET